jgi:hypothetical protein
MSFSCSGLRLGAGIDPETGTKKSDVSGSVDVDIATAMDVAASSDLKIIQARLRPEECVRISVTYFLAQKSNSSWIALGR